MFEIQTGAFSAHVPFLLAEAAGCWVMAGLHLPYLEVLGNLTCFVTCTWCW